ncbi:hypothetical protein [Nesterenkonia sp. NBAIMH1]|nr:hypothetical protein [Nesterenkonia sp. NBAIMH1]
MVAALKKMAVTFLKARVLAKFAMPKVLLILGAVKVIRWAFARRSRAPQ